LFEISKLRKVALFQRKATMSMFLYHSRKKIIYGKRKRKNFNKPTLWLYGVIACGTDGIQQNI
jgi:hypothetical protein